MSDTINEVKDINLNLHDTGYVAEILTNSPSKTTVHHVIIALPGIRTNASWIDGLEEEIVEQGHNNFKVYKVSDGYINVFKLITRWNIWKTKYHFLAEIGNIISDHNGQKISIIAHSMGTAILSEIAQDIHYKFDHIFLLGSICHQKKIKNLLDRADQIHVDQGSKDWWPIVAQAVRPDSYSYTGVYGANSNRKINQRRFENDHSNCTSIYHIRTNILPILSENGIAKRSPAKDLPALWKVMILIWVIRSAPAIILLILYAIYML